MYYHNPGFLTLAGEEASDLAILQTIARSQPGVITPAFVLELTRKDIITGEKAKVELAAPKAEEEEEIKALEELRKRL